MLPFLVIESDDDSVSDSSEMSSLNLNKSETIVTNKGSSRKSSQLEQLMCEDNSGRKAAGVEASVSVADKTMKIQGEVTKRGTILISFRHSRFAFDKWVEDAENVRLVTRLRNAKRMPLDAASFRRVKDLHAKARAGATTILDTTSKIYYIIFILLVVSHFVCVLLIIFNFYNYYEYISDLIEYCFNYQANIFI